MDDSCWNIPNLASSRALLPCLVRGGAEERWFCALSHTGINRHKAFQPWNLSYSAGLHFLLLLYTHHNRRCSHRGRLWRLQQNATHRPALPISGLSDVINEHWKNTIFKLMNQFSCIVAQTMRCVCQHLLVFRTYCWLKSRECSLDIIISMNGWSYQIITVIIRL